MEDFIEIIFYVVILVLSGIGSLLKNKKKQQETVFSPKPTEVKQEHKMEEDVPEQPIEAEENELIRMLREAAEAAAAQQREKELLEQQQAQLKEEQRQKELAEKARQAEILRAKREAEQAKIQSKTKKDESKPNTTNDTPIVDLDFSNVDDVRRAFIASEIFNKKYC